MGVRSRAPEDSSKSVRVTAQNGHGPGRDPYGECRYLASRMSGPVASEFLSEQNITRRLAAWKNA
jgi:hypothetical protein